MRPPDVPRATKLRNQLVDTHKADRSLPGIEPRGFLECLVEQLIESVRRIEFVHRVRDAKIDPRRNDPNSGLFDPLRAAVIENRRGNVDEAWWLIFLATHCGKHAKDGWRLARDIYGRLGVDPHWTWSEISSNTASFRLWLAENEHILRGSDGVSRRFSNHRKYESLRADSDKSTATVIETYVNWVEPPRTHSDMIRNVHKIVGQNPREVFDYLYKSMDSVLRFGRLGKFDFLTMLGKLGVAPLDPPSAYLESATGPRSGAILLFSGRTNTQLKAASLNSQLLQLDDRLNVGMQVLEDALCNWQKSPGHFISFRG